MCDSFRRRSPRVDLGSSIAHSKRRMDLESLFDEFEAVAFRLETLPFFPADSRKPAYHEFASTGTLPSDHNAAWRSEIREGTAGGRSYRRLRLFSKPLSEYEKYEQASFSLSLEAGEDIRAVHRIDPVPDPDFWAFDDRWIAVMDYDSEGEFRGADVREMSASDRDLVTKWMRVFETEGRDPRLFS